MYLLFPSEPDTRRALLLQSQHKGHLLHDLWVTTNHPYFSKNQHPYFSFNLLCSSLFHLVFNVEILKPSQVLPFTGGNQNTPEINTPVYLRKELMDLLPAKKEVTAVNKTNHHLSNQVINSRKLQSLYTQICQGVICCFKGKKKFGIWTL